VGVFTLGELGPDLIAGGAFRSAGPIVAHNIARWDGSSWHVMTAGTNGIVYAQAVYGGDSGGDLVAGGSFNVAGGVAVDRIAGWDGTFWYPLAGGLAGGDYSVDALTLLGTQLIAGGVFTLADSLPANRIAAWDGSSWTSLGSGTDGAVRALMVFDSQLYVGGTFSTAGGRPSFNIARWDPPASSVSAGGAGSGSGPFAPGPVSAPLRIDARPNPFREAIRFACDLPSPGPVRIEIFDPLGRRLADLSEGDAPGGLHTFAWNGNDASGVPLPRGAYLARISCAGARGEIRITRIR
jgi:hypothetical protein